MPGDDIKPNQLEVPAGTGNAELAPISDGGNSSLTLAELAKVDVTPFAREASKLADAFTHPLEGELARIAKSVATPWNAELAKMTESITKPWADEFAKLAEGITKPLTDEFSKFAEVMTKPLLGEFNKIAGSAFNIRSSELAELTKIADHGAMWRGVLDAHAKAVSAAFPSSVLTKSLLGDVDSAAITRRLFSEINSPALVKSALGDFGSAVWQERILGGIGPSLFVGKAGAGGSLAATLKGLSTFAFPKDTYADAAFPPGSFSALSGLKVPRGIDAASVLPKGVSSRLSDIVYPDGLFDLITDISQEDAYLDRSLADEPGPSGLIGSTTAFMSSLTESSGGRFSGKILTANQAAKILVGVLVTSLAVLAWAGIPKQFQTVTDIMSWPAAVLGIWATLEAVRKK